MADRKFKTKMKIILVLSIITGVLPYRRPSCHACFDGICHTRSNVFTAHKFSGQLAVDTNSNILYFHYQTNHSIDHTGAFDLNNIKFNIIPKLSFTFARAVDQRTQEVYMSGTIGIYKYNPTIKKIKSIGLTDKTIWHLQFKNKLHYSLFKTKGVYIYDKNKSIGIRQLSNYQIDDFVIDKKNDLYFMSESIIYRLKNGTNNAEFFIDEIFSLAIDKKGEAHFIQPASRGVYKMDYSKDILVEIGTFGSGTPFKVVFDADNNMIYHDTDEEKIYYMTPNYSLCSVATKGRGRNTKKFVAMSNK